MIEVGSSLVSKAPHALRTFRLLLLMCILVPLGAYLAVGAYRYSRVAAEVEVRLDRSLQIAYEHALKVVETAEGLIEQVQGIVADADDALLNVRERAIHQQLEALSRGKQQYQGILVLGVDGKLIVNSRTFPTANLDLKDRDYFRWHQSGQTGLFVSQLMISRVINAPFFDLSRARRDSRGNFSGVTSVSLSPQYFERFHTALTADEPGLAIGLFREDGVIFSRTPTVSGAPTKLGSDSPVLSKIRGGHTAGSTRGVSTVDGRNRIFAFRKLADFPIYVAAGIDLATIRRGWAEEMAWLLAFGIPPFMCLFVTVRLAMRRTEQALEAADRQRVDTEALRRAEVALSETRKLEALGRLTGGVAHDFNNALMVLNNNLLLLRRKAPTAGLSHIDAMTRAIASATQLTRRLLGFSRQQPYTPEIVDLQSKLPDIRGGLAPVLGGAIQLDINVDPATQPIHIDPAELDAALLNLVINARDAMPDGGQITVTARNASNPLPLSLAGQFVVVEVIDTGSGIAAENVARVFEPFFTTKPIGQGTGLGMTQVLGLCKRAEGTAIVHSALGEGTTVSMFFPACLDAPVVAARAVEIGPLHIQTSVLLVEDNAEVARTLVDVLTDMGARVHCVDNATVALQWLRSTTKLPVWMLSDVVMPGEMDGLALARVVRTEWPALHIALMSGYTINASDIQRAGFVLLTKPVSHDQLAQLLSSIEANEPRRP